MGVIIGTAKRDVLRGTDPSGDEIWGRAGNDVLVAGDWSAPDGSPGEVATTLHGEAGNDRLLCGRGHVQAYGGDGRDTLVGGAGVDWLHGEAGNDVLVDVGGGDVFMFGGHGSDRFEVRSATVEDWEVVSATVFDFEAGDRLRILGEDGRRLTFRSLDTNRDRVIDDADDNVTLTYNPGEDQGYPSNLPGRWAAPSTWGPDTTEAPPVLLIGTVALVGITELGRGDLW